MVFQICELNVLNLDQNSSNSIEDESDHSHSRIRTLIEFFEIELKQNMINEGNPWHLAN